MQEMWQTVKEYFRDGFVPGSAPLRFNVHYCDLRRPPTKTDNIRLGGRIDEEAMPLFTALGDTCAPPCSCQDVQVLAEHIDDFISKAPDSHVNDYAITSEKGDKTVDQVCLYTMRDSLSWWVHWGGALQASHYWKQMYVGFATAPDDVQLPPQHVINGTFRFLGHTFSECLEGLLAEGVHRDLVKFAEMCFWRQAICQYLEKVDPGLRPLLVSKMTLMTQYRVLTANTLGCGALFLATEGPVAQPLSYDALEIASIAQCLSLDMAKEALGVLQGEKTETVAGDRVQMKRELRWAYARGLEYLDTQPDEHLRRFASAGLNYVPMMDRYHERVRGNVRFPISEGMGRILDRFIKRETPSDSPAGLSTGFPQHIDARIDAVARS